MSDPVEIWFRDGDTGFSVCIYSRMDFESVEDALFLAMMDGDLYKPDEFVLWTLKKLRFLTSDDDPCNYGISSLPGRCTEQYHVDFKQKTIKYVTMDYRADPSEQMTIKKLWTLEDFYNTHRTAALDRLPPPLPVIFLIPKALLETGGLFCFNHPSTVTIPLFRTRNISKLNP